MSSWNADLCLLVRRSQYSSFQIRSSSSSPGYYLLCSLSALWGQSEPKILRLAFSFPRVSGLHGVTASEPQRWGGLWKGVRGVPPHPPLPPLQPPPELRAVQELQPDCARRQPEPPQHQPLMPQHQGEWLNIMLSASTNDDCNAESQVSRIQTLQL